MVELSPTGEIASFLDVNQFQPGRTQFACGFFACAIVKSMSPTGQQPTQTVQQMIAEALHSTRNNQQQAAKVLGLSRQGLINKMKRYAIAG